jgi:hypothetical protein
MLLSHMRLGSLFVASYDSEGYGGSILTRLHTGLPTYCYYQSFLYSSKADQTETTAFLIVLLVYYAIS